MLPVAAWPGLAVFAALLIAAVFMAAHGAAVLAPATGIFTEANGDVIEICADAACTSHTTAFAPGKRVYVRVTTTRVSSRSSGNIQLRNYLQSWVASGAWTQTSSSSPYVYTGSVLIPANSPNYLKITGLVKKGTPALDFEVQLGISTLTTQYMKFYADAARTDESYTFRPGAVVYVSAYGSGGAYSSSYTAGNNRLYDFTNAAKYSWTAPAVTQNSRMYNFPLALPGAGSLIDGDWYDLRTLLKNTGNGVIEHMSDMIQIDNTPPVGAIASPAASDYVKGTVPVSGTASDATSFYQYQLDYGAGASPGSWTAIATGSSPVTNGSLGAWDTTAAADGAYTLRLRVWDRAGWDPSAPTTVTVPVNVDNNPPVISGVAVSAVTGTSATVTWNTDKTASSQVFYGTSSGSYPDSTVLDTTQVTSHSQNLGGLSPGTNYFYKVCSADGGNNNACSAESTFTTAYVTVLQPFAGIGDDTEFGTGQPSWNWGADQYLRVGDLAADPDIVTMRSALKFDLAGIPANASILSANLSLYQMAQGDTSAPFLVAFGLTRAWTSGTLAGSQPADGATWNTADGTSAWTSPGGDYSSFLGWTQGANSTGAWLTWSLNTASVQGWVSNPAANYGLILKNLFESAGGSDLKKFYSSDYTGDATLRPKLVVVWRPATVGYQTAPKIGEVRAENIHTASADIKWSTDDNASSQVCYGTTTSYGACTAVTDAGGVNQHLVTLSGLTVDQDYHYKVVSTDTSGNSAGSADQVFHTARLITITATQDTWISSAASKQNLNFGGDTDIDVGENGAAEARRGLLRFDLSAIPYGSTINNATLSLNEHSQADTSTPALGVYYVLPAKLWTEGTGTGTASGDGATWLSYDGPGADTWSSPGGDGDFNATASATASALDVSGGAGWVNWDVSGLAQSWISGSVANNGVFIKKTSGSGATDFKSFYSADYANAMLRPKLVIEYVPAPVSITMTISGTYNRDGSSGGGTGVDFGQVDPLKPYVIGSGGTPPAPYAVQLSLQSNALWSLSVAASSDLTLQSNPADTISVANLAWKASGSADPWRPFQTASDPITSGYPVLTPQTFGYDFQLNIPNVATPGSYITKVVYTAAYAG